MREIEKENQLIRLERIKASKTNPRKAFDPERLEKLRESMRASGLIQPITVRPDGEDFEIVAGESRFRCAKDLGWETIECLVRDLDPVEMAVVQIAENVNRNSLNPIEESEGLSRLVELGLDPGAIAGRVGVRKDWVQGRLALGELPEGARAAVADETLSIASARMILKVEPEDREEVCQDLLQFGSELTTAHVVDRLQERYFRPREQRRAWREWCGKRGDLEEGENEFLEDPFSWAEYVHSYGKPVGKWKLAKDPVGKAAARIEEEGVTWGELARALGVLGLLVPVGGVIDSSFANVVCLVDGGKILAAEKAARKAGAAFTLGPRDAGAGAGEVKGEDEDDEEWDDEEEEEFEPVAELLKALEMVLEEIGESYLACRGEVLEIMETVKGGRE